MRKRYEILAGVAKSIGSNHLFLIGCYDWPNGWDGGYQIGMSGDRISHYPIPIHLPEEELAKWIETQFHAAGIKDDENEPRKHHRKRMPKWEKEPMSSPLPEPTKLYIIRLTKKGSKGRQSYYSALGGQSIVGRLQATRYSYQDACHVRDNVVRGYKGAVLEPYLQSPSDNDECVMILDNYPVGWDQPIKLEIDAERITVGQIILIFGVRYRVDGKVNEKVILDRGLEDRVVLQDCAYLENYKHPKQKPDGV